MNKIEFFKLQKEAKLSTLKIQEGDVLMIIKKLKEDFKILIDSPLVYKLPISKIAEKLVERLDEINKINQMKFTVLDESYNGIVEVLDSEGFEGGEDESDKDETDIDEDEQEEIKRIIKLKIDDLKQAIASKNKSQIVSRYAKVFRIRTQYKTLAKQIAADLLKEEGLMMEDIKKMYKGGLKKITKITKKSIKSKDDFEPDDDEPEIIEESEEDE